MRLLCHCGTLRQAARAITSLYDAQLAKHGIRITQYTILATLGRAEGVSTSQLADDLLMDQTTLSRTLATLRTKGLVEADVGDDLRMRFWSLTPNGSELLRACESDWRAAQDELYRRAGKRHVKALDAQIYDLASKLIED
ncbi:MarR family transcriptional regulator [Trinickia terrae]|uniref:MarR family transcriptional regulator n=1 Tax=Trinickia terrae TaxID=2571161 RepID=A0A4U1HZH3_9BURK|nr:MarR family transcriptional regulator [Trinickia terrae]TKC86368.1 MarR family transcriptional regulator [Trinickia terrae]